VNDKFLPIGGTDLWSHYPAPRSFLEDDSPWPEVPAQPRSGLADLRVVASAAGEPGEDRMIGSLRAAGTPPAEDWMLGSPRAAGTPPAEDWMLGSPRAAGEPDHPNQNGARSPAPESADPQLAAARARYEEAIAALDEHTYAATPFTDSTMALTQ
jgi:hypothetical protein